MEKMDVDDVVDLSMGRDAVSLSNATVRDLRALTQNAGLTITPAPPSVNTGMCIYLCVFVSIHLTIQAPTLTLSKYLFAWFYVTRVIHIFYFIFFFAFNFSINQTEPYSRRVLRPRTEPKSYAEAPDIVLLPAKINGRQQNGNIDSDTDDEEMPPIIAIKVSD